jgi:uncharacterized protein (DUF1501 family)
MPAAADPRASATRHGLKPKAPAHTYERRAAATAAAAAPAARTRSHFRQTACYRSALTAD